MLRRYCAAQIDDVDRWQVKLFLSAEYGNRNPCSTRNGPSLRHPEAICVQCLQSAAWDKIEFTSQRQFIPLFGIILQCYMFLLPSSIIFLPPDYG